jgi:hypothetical protein
MEARASFDGAWAVPKKLGLLKIGWALPFTILLRAVPAGYLD